MSADLEARYRAALRWYPRSWRVANADAIVGTMLDQAEADGRATPLRGELRDLAVSGVGARAERIAPQVVRDRVAAIALVIGMAYAVIMFVASEWAPFAETSSLNGWMFLPDSPNYREYSTVGFGPFASVMVIVYALWITAFVLVMLRFSRTAVVVLLASVPVLVWIRTLRFDDIGMLQPSTAALIIVALVAVLATGGQPARVGLRTTALMAAAAAATVVVLLLLSGNPPVYEGRLAVASGTFSVLNAPAFGIILLLVGVGLAIGRRRAWSVAALVSAAPWLSLSVVYFLPFAIALPVGGLTGLLCLTSAVTVWKFRSASGLSSRSS